METSAYVPHQMQMIGSVGDDRRRRRAWQAAVWFDTFGRRPAFYVNGKQNYICYSKTQAPFVNGQFDKQCTLPSCMHDRFWHFIFYAAALRFNQPRACMLKLTTSLYLSSWNHGAHACTHAVWQIWSCKTVMSILIFRGLPTMKDIFSTSHMSIIIIIHSRLWACFLLTAPT